MNATTKLNSAIRALYKAKAKECIVARSDKAQNAIDAQMKQIVDELHSRPVVAALVAKLAKARDVRDAAVVAYEGAELALNTVTQCEYKQDGTFAYFEHSKSPNQANQRYSALQSKRTRTIAGHVKDSPEVLSFVADLSLVKTVGEADALLAKL